MNSKLKSSRSELDTKYQQVSMQVVFGRTQYLIINNEKDIMGQLAGSGYMHVYVSQPYDQPGNKRA